MISNNLAKQERIINMKKLITILLITLLLTACAKKENTNASFSLWNKDGVINELIDYVTDVTNPKSANYIPEEDRIAVFDLDGTLLCEQAPTYIEFMLYCYRVLDDPTYNSTTEMKDLAGEILYGVKNGALPETAEENESILFGQAFDDMLVDEYKEYLKAFIENKVDNFDNMTFKDSYFRPMVQVLDYLNKNGFIIYICSGTDRDFDRIIMDNFYHIPYYQVIGTDCYSEGNHHDDENYLDYQYDNDEKIMRDETRIIKNVKSAKVTQLYQEIGQKPVLAFGNSTGDSSMFTYTASNDKYKTAIFCIVPDDDEREYANMSKVEKLTKNCEENGYHVVSMKNDFLQIYGDEVKKNPDNKKLLNHLILKYEETKQD